MRDFHRIIIPVLALFFIGCSPASRYVPADWQQREQAALRDGIAQWHVDGGDMVRLSVTSVAQLDGQTLLLGGSYRTPAASMRSVLLRSSDAGKTWHDTGVWLTGSETTELFALDAQHAWAVVNWSIEGWLPPFAVFRTTDGGQTWQRSMQNLPLSDENAGIPLEFGIRFASPDIGIAWLVGSAGDRYHYLTTDGGMNWRLVHHSKYVTFDDLPDQPRIDREHSPGGMTRIIVRYAGEAEPHSIDIPSGGYYMNADGSVVRR